jgi:hypothetical protein
MEEETKREMLLLNIKLVAKETGFFKNNVKI